MFFNGSDGLGRMLVMRMLSYAGLIVLLRVSGKRTLVKMNAFDLIITMALGSTLATVILSKDIALAEGCAALALLVVLRFMVTGLSVRFRTVSRWVRGEPALLLYRGELLVDALRAQRVTQSEIEQAARSHGIDDLINCAVVLETNGTFRVLPARSISSSPTLHELRDSSRE